MKDCPKCKKCKDCQEPKKRKRMYPGNFKNFDEFMNDCFRRIIHKPAEKITDEISSEYNEYSQTHTVDRDE